MRKEFYDMRLRVLITFGVLTVLFFSLAPLQNFAIDMLKEIPQNAQRLIPKNFLDRLKEWDFYILSQWFGKNFGQFVPIIGIIIAFPLFSREYENGTIEFLLSRKKRRKVFGDKFFTALISLAFVILVLSYLPYLYSLATGKNLELSTVSKYALREMIGGFFWMSVALFFSTFMTDQVKPLLSSIAALGMTIAAGFVEKLRFLNTYPYILGNDILNGKIVNENLGIWLSTLGVFLVLLSLFIFERKEI